jgi:pimeloyl-ACP methyl ester carboxylesterase
MFRLLVFGPMTVFVGLFGAVYFQNRLLYNNWGPQPRFIWKSAADVEEVSFKTADGEILSAYWCDSSELPDWKLPEKPVVLFCHGNSCTIDQWRWVIDRWTWMIGADVLIFDYRGYGRSTGTPTEEGLYKDARAAYDWLVQEKNIDPRRVIIVGQSLGGGVAVRLAGEVEHRLMVLESTFTCMCDVVDGVFFGAPMGYFCHQRFPNLDRIREYRKPLFLSHGDRDRLIPYWHSERLLEAAGGPTVLWRCDRMGHNDQRDYDEYTSLIRRFLEQHWK